MDCTNGCDGGNPLTVFTTILSKPAVESWYRERERESDGERDRKRERTEERKRVKDEPSDKELQPV